MANQAVKETSYAATAAEILDENLVLPFLGSQEFRDPTDTFKVWVAGDESMVDYTEDGIASTTPNGAYVDVANPKDKAIFKSIDKNALRKTYNPVEYIDEVVKKVIQASAVQLDKDVLAVLVAGGTEISTTAPTASTINDDIIALETAFNLAKVPLEGRTLIVSGAVAALIEKSLVLNTAFGDEINRNGFKTIGSAHGFNLMLSLYIPTNVGMIAVHGNGFGGNFEQIEEVELTEVVRGHGKIGAWAIDGRIAYNYGVLRPTFVQVHSLS